MTEINITETPDRVAEVVQEIDSPVQSATAIFTGASEQIETETVSTETYSSSNENTFSDDEEESNYGPGELSIEWPVEGGQLGEVNTQAFDVNRNGAVTFEIPDADTYLLNESIKFRGVINAAVRMPSAQGATSVNRIMISIGPQGDSSFTRLTARVDYTVETVNTSTSTICSEQTISVNDTVVAESGEICDGDTQRVSLTDSDINNFVAESDNIITFREESNVDSPNEIDFNIQLEDVDASVSATTQSSICPTDVIQVQGVLENLSSTSAVATVNITGPNISNVNDSFNVPANGQKEFNIPTQLEDISRDIGVNASAVFEFDGVNETVERTSSDITQIKNVAVNTDVISPDAICAGKSTATTGVVTNVGDCPVSLDINFLGVEDSVELQPDEQYENQLDVSIGKEPMELSLDVEGSSGMMEISESTSDTLRSLLPSGGIVNSEITDVSEVFGTTSHVFNIELTQCSAQVVLQVIDNEENEMVAQKLQRFSAGDTNQLSPSFSMPPRLSEFTVEVFARVGSSDKVPEGRVSEGNDYILIDSDTFAIRPANAVIINSNEDIQYWGSINGSISYSSVIAGNNINPENLESGDTLVRNPSTDSLPVDIDIGLNSLDIVSLDNDASSGTTDVLSASSINEGVITSDTEVDLVVNGNVRETGKKFTLKSSNIGSLGFLPHTQVWTNTF